MSSLTLLDVAKRNGSDKIVGLIEENLNQAPELNVFPMRTIKGTQYKTLIRTGFPTTGFRKANKGMAASKSSYRNALVECFIFGGRVEIDKAVAEADEDGPQAMEMDEANGVMASALLNLGKQIFYGVTQDASGFPGLQSFVDSTLTLDATGTTANTGSSVYGVKFGAQGVQLVGGQGNAFVLPPFRDETIRDADNNPLPGRVSDLCGWIGMQAVNKNSVCRLKNLTADSGKGLTDALLATLLSQCPIGFVPDYWFMSRRSRLQLQISRSTVNAVGLKTSTGKENFAPLPTESNGVPIICTDSIGNTEAIA